MRTTKPMATMGAVLLALVVATFGLAGCGAPTARSSSSDPTLAKLSATRIAIQSRPAARLIRVDFAARLAIPRTAYNRPALEAEVANLPPEQRSAVVADLIIKEPRKYLTSQGEDRKDFKTTAIGSGFALTPDGHIVTNAHVATPNEESLKEEFLKEGLRKTFEQQARAIEVDFAGEISEAKRELLTKSIAIYTAEKSRVDSNIDKKITVFADQTIKQVASGNSGLEAKVVGGGEEYPGKDVALLKAEAKDLPTLLLDTDEPQVGSTLYAIGYPGKGTFGTGRDVNSVVESTQTQGTVSGFQGVKGGYRAIQTNADVSHGNSGGPAINDEGKVVGLVTAGVEDDGGNFNLIVPSSVVKELLDKHGVVPTESDQMKEVKKGLDLASNQHYKAAKKSYEKAGNLGPFLDKIVQDNQRQIDAGKDVPLGPSTATIIGGGAGGVAVLVLLAALVIWGSSRRKKHQPALAGSAAEIGAGTGFGAPAGLSTLPQPSGMRASGSSSAAALGHSAATYPSSGGSSAWNPPYPTGAANETSRPASSPVPVGPWPAPSGMVPAGGYGNDKPSSSWPAPSGVNPQSQELNLDPPTSSGTVNQHWPAPSAGTSPVNQSWPPPGAAISAPISPSTSPVAHRWPAPSVGQAQAEPTYPQPSGLDRNEPTQPTPPPPSDWYKTGGPTPPAR